MEINIYSASAIAFLALILGYWIGSKIAQSGTTSCDLPTAFRSTIIPESSEVRLDWSHGSNRASEYMVIVYDVADGKPPSFFRSYITTDNSFVLNELLPKQNYYVELLSRCGTGDGSEILPEVLNGTFNTQEFIIVDEVVHINTPGAKKSPEEQEVCNNMVSCSVIQSPNNSFNWLDAAGGKEYYNIQIRTRGASPTVMVNAFLVKGFTETGQKKVTNFVDLVCGGTAGDALNEPSKGACSPVQPNILCGSFYNVSNVSYRVVILTSSCSVQFTDPAQAQDYEVRVSRCTGSID